MPSDKIKLYFGFNIYNNSDDGKLQSTGNNPF